MTYKETEIKTSVLALQENLLLLEAQAYEAKADELKQRAIKCREYAAELCHEQNKIWQAADEFIS